MTSTPQPVACALNAHEAEAQALEWVDLQRLALRTAPLPSGARMAFPASDASRVADLAEREATCCTFLNITTSFERDEFVVDITSDSPDAIGVIAALSGVTLS